MTYPTLAYYSLAFCTLLLLALVALWRVSLQRITELRRGLDHAARFAAESREAADSLAEMAKTEKRRADEFFTIIEGVEKERDTWQKLYQTSSYQSGVAQAWLLRDLSASVRVANDYAQRLRTLGEHVPQVGVDPRLTDVLAEFGETHTRPAPEAKPPAG
jgi:biopolymer transport protein ExbB/TolQ